MMVTKVAILCLGALAPAIAFSPSSFTPAVKGRATPAVSAARPKHTTKMSLEGIEAAQYVLGAVPNVPFVDEITGEPQGFTAPLNHFGSVIGLWALFALPVWSAAYKQAGCDTEEWTGVSQTLLAAPGIGKEAKYIPSYDGPSFREGLEYTLSFLWKPPILVAWKPRADLDRAEMDPARDTVVSSLYKSLGGALDKTAVYDEEDQLLILSDIETFPETDLGRRREKQAIASGIQVSDAVFGRSIIEIARLRAQSGNKVSEETININAAELAALRAAAGMSAKSAPKPAPVVSKPAPKPAVKAAPKPAAVAPPAPKPAVVATPKPAAPKPAAPKPTPVSSGTTFSTFSTFSVPKLPTFTPPEIKFDLPAAPKIELSMPAVPKPAAPAASKPADNAAAKAAEARAEQAKKQAAAAAAAKAAAAAATAAAAKAAAAAPKATPQIGLGTMPVPKSVNIPFFGKTQAVTNTQPVPPKAAPMRSVGTTPVRSAEASGKAAAYEGKGLPQASDSYDFPGMQLLFGEGTLKEGLVPAWEPSLELDNWGNPLPNASEATRRAVAEKKAEAARKELENKSTYPYDPNSVLRK